MHLLTTELVWHELDGELVVLNLSSSTYLGLNPSGRAMFLLLLEGADEHRLCAELGSAYGLDDQRAADDVATFLRQLREHGVLSAG